MALQGIMPQSIIPTPWEKQGKSYQKWKADIDKQKAIDEYWANKRRRGGGGGGGGESGSGSEAMEEAQAEANRIAEEQLEIAKRQQEIAEERYKWWKENYQPFEKEFIQKAKMGEDQKYAAERAGNEQLLGQQAAKESYGREMQRLGMDPNDPKYASLMANWDLYKQAAVAGARNTARQQAAERTRNLRAQVAGMGTGLAPQAVSTYGAAAQSMSGGAESKAAGAAGLAGAYNTGMKARLGAEQFASELAARQGSLALGQQELAAKRNLFDQQLASQQKQYQWGQQGALYGSIGQLVGLGAGIGLTSYLGGLGGSTGSTAGQMATIGSMTRAVPFQDYGATSSAGGYNNFYSPLLFGTGAGSTGGLNDYGQKYLRH